MLTAITREGHSLSLLQLITQLPANVPPFLLSQAYGVLEAAARTVLASLCRSSLLRLRGDACAGLLDDLPLSRGVQGSSCLTATAYTDNFSGLLLGGGGAGAGGGGGGAGGGASTFLPLFADPQVCP